MARSIHRLADIAIKSAKKTGRLGDGGNLYLRVSATHSKSWSFMWKVDRRPQEMGIGSYPTVSLAGARKIAARYREVISEGGDPRHDRDKEAEPVFEIAVEAFLATMEGQWSNAKHRAQWRMTLTEYCTTIKDKRVSQIGLSEVLKVLQPIWHEKPETASRLRGRIERVLNFAKVKGWREGENPALWRGNLENVLPKPTRNLQKHHAAMSYQDLPVFFKSLAGHEALAARALEFLILTACRSGEVIGAQWPEIDLDARIWTLPPERMKARKEHRVPLSGSAIAILEPLSKARISDWVFPGQKHNRPLSGMAIEMLLRRMKVKGATPHGFRSTFRDWCGDETSFPREIAEAALAHSVGSAVELAYRRSDALEKRRQLMNAWADYCGGVEHDKVVKLHA